MKSKEQTNALEQNMSYMFLLILSFLRYPINIAFLI